MASATRKIRSNRTVRPRWRRVIVYPFLCVAFITVSLVAIGFYHIYFDRTNLPDIGPFIRFEFPAVGHIYDANGETLIKLARECRQNIKYEDIPPIVRDAILAAEDKNFFSHNGVDYTVFPRVLAKIRVGALASRLMTLGRQDEVNGPAIFPQGGSTITQQLVRGHFLKYLTSFQNLTSQENRDEVRQGVLWPRALSRVISARSVLMMVRKVEEIRLSLWVEKEMRNRFGSKRRAKEEILARYASFIYMGNRKYGFAAASEFYFNRPLAVLGAHDADLAALLAGIAKAPRHYAPNAQEKGRVLHRRDETLRLMAKNGFISMDALREAEKRPFPILPRQKKKMPRAPSVVENIFEELNDRHIGLDPEDLLRGRIQIYSTVDARVQQIVNEALENGIDLYEKRHPNAKGLIQGSVVVLKNRDAGILAETGGRQFYKGRTASYGDFNRVTQSLRQYGSAMKPIVYLAAFQKGKFNLDSRVPDSPIGVPDDGIQTTKWISNYDGQFKGMIPLRKALAESRNAVAIWIIKQIGIVSVSDMSRGLGVRTPLKPYVSSALGASEVKLLELANAYRTMASGILTQPYVIRKIVRDSGEVVADNEQGVFSVDLSHDGAITLIQEGLRGVIRIPGGTGHSLDSKGFPIAIMGKTGTTNEFRDALFIGSTYGPEGITVAVRIGFDDNRSLGPKETGGRVALPIFREIMLAVYREKIVGPVPAFPVQMEKNINAYLADSSVGQDKQLEEE